MTRFRLISITIFITLLVSCSRTTELKEDNHNNKVILTINSIPKRDSLDAKIIQTIKPLFSDIDTIVLDDTPPLYCVNATEQEVTKDYFSIASNPKIYIKLNERLEKKILLQSKINEYEPNFSTKKQEASF